MSLLQSLFQLILMQSLPLMIIILIGGLIFFKSIFNLRVYKNSFVDGVDSLLHFNLLVLAAFSQYEFKRSAVTQLAVAYTSTVVAFLLFIVAIVYITLLC